MNNGQIPQEYERAYADALFMIESECEPRSALKEAASSHGIPYGAEMKDFVEWAEAKLLSE
jgi:hypothetical protein